MILSRRILIQLALFTVVSLAAGLTMALGYIRLPVLLFGVGHYEVGVELPQSAGLYPRGNVTYRGTEVGQVKSLQLTDAGVQAVLSLRSDIKIPSDLDAAVHSQNAIGEQYIALLPRNGSSAPLKDGDVIPANRTSVPPNINHLLDATNRGLQAIPGDNLHTAVDEAYTAVGGLGPELSRIVDGATSLAIDARANLDSFTNLIDNGGALLDTQTDTADSVQAAAAHLATITSQLKTNDTAVRGILQDGPAAADAGRQLFERMRPTLPVLLANLVSLGQVAVTYRAGLEQLLVLLPQGAATMQAAGVANKDTKQDYKGAYLSFNLNVNLPPPCTTGFLPTQQQRTPSDVDYPDRPAGDLYCRVPQDSAFNVRGAKNIPCETKPGKRAPTAAMCESDETYVPLNDGFNWKGDPNATLSGQPIPQLGPGEQPQAAPPPLLAVTPYNPDTGTYVGPDGKVYTQSDLGRTAQEKTWQSLIMPPQ
ncbi:MCE family protein [Mycolicibacterium alvei]|uniref:Mammalian cell entry protein n=1 Tax=Mycolicibacterium alvei TaxID=67081 RepID=A0A6N4UTG1_9MYCO|nr:MlaD family protein [Mycolicibacterium alvei]MCV7003939.1 MCE family protein [Mycolicibacterium alvei]BBX27698.1 mammalian cell entry protein [Mycolicibacterium alvei]